MDGDRIYLDNHATTPCDPRVVDAMLPTFGRCFGNAASHQHAFGREAEALVDRARERVAALIGCETAEIVFTSGASESDNLAIKGAARAARRRGRHVVTSAIEHKAVLDSCQRLEEEGFEVTYVGVDGEGVTSIEEVERALRDDTLLVSLIYGNNEIGTVNPIPEVGALCRQRGVLFHCDAVQALPYLKCDVQELNVDLLSLSAHKMYGPKGVGALYVRRRRPRVRLEPIVDGGGHERGMRSGTLNVPGIVGLGKACELVAEERERDAERVARLRDRLLELLRLAFPDVRINGSLDRRLPNNLNVSFTGVDADALLGKLERVAVSSGAACTSASRDGSYVVKCLARAESRDASPEEVDTRAASSIRFGLGRFTTAEEIEVAAADVIAAVSASRSDRDAATGGVDPPACDPCGLDAANPEAADGGMR